MAGMSENTHRTRQPDGPEMPLLKRLREELKQDDADLRAILTQVVDVLIHNEAGETIYDPFAGQSFYPIKDNVKG